jgi:hypothetical protein
MGTRDKIAKALVEQVLGPFKRVTGAVESHPDYVYHATSADRVPGIAEEGLRRHMPHEFTEQEVWPDGTVHPRNYFTPTAQNTWQFAPEEGSPALLRAPRAAHQFMPERGTGDLYSTQDLPANLLEYLHENNSWMPLIKKEPGQ